MGAEMSIFHCLRKHRNFLRCIVYCIDAMLVIFSALCAFTFITWGEKFGFLSNAAFWGWLALNVAFVLLLFTGLKMYSFSFTAVGMPEAMRVVVL